MVAAIDHSNVFKLIDINETLVKALVRATGTGLEMTGIAPKPVGTSQFLRASRELSVVIGLTGKHSGSVRFNLSTKASLLLAKLFLDETHEEIDEDTLDAIGEIGNMVAGGLKSALVGTQFEVSAISVPSIIMGAGHELYNCRGFHTVSVEFELPQDGLIYTRDRLFTTSVSFAS